MTGVTLWTPTKGENRARAVSRSVPGVGVELRFIWNDDTRSTQVYRNVVELAAAANAKREQLRVAGWVGKRRRFWRRSGGRRRQPGGTPSVGHY